MHDMKFIGKFTLLKKRLQQISAKRLWGTVGVFLLFSICVHAEVRTGGFVSEKPECDSSCTFVGRVMFPKSSAVVSYSFADNQVRVDSIRSFLLNLNYPPLNINLLSVSVVGSYSPEGGRAFNTRLAAARASALADMAKEFGLSADPVISVVHPAGRNVDYAQQRFAELKVVYRRDVLAGNAVGGDTLSSEDSEAPVCDGDSGAGQESLTEVVESARYSADSTACQHTFTSDAVAFRPAGHTIADRLFVTTNMLYDAALIPNIGLGIMASGRLTLHADWMYARWSNRDRVRYWRIYGGDIEVKYRVGRRHKRSPLGGHHIGVYGSMACYDFQAGRSHRGFLSDKWNYAAGISYTYSLPVAEHFNIDFSLGVGYLWGTYKRHTHIDDCNVWLSTHKLGWFGSTRVGVTLVWLPGKSVKNVRKGGGL